jgi:periplasmic protein CpxP/Spy
MQNRKLMSPIWLLILGMGMAVTAVAQVSPATPSPQSSTHSPFSSSGNQQTGAQGQQKSIDDELQLTSDQKQKIAAIVDDERKQMVALRDDNSLSLDQKQQKAMQIRQTGAPKIKALLTSEQLQKLAEIQQREQQQPASGNQGSPQAPQR